MYTLLTEPLAGSRRGSAAAFLLSAAPCWLLAPLVAASRRRSARAKCAHSGAGQRVPQHHVLCGMGKHRTSSDTPGDFDIYLLAQTWAPQFCCTKSDRCTTVSCAYSAS